MHEPSFEHQPVLLKQESKSSSTYRSRADEAAAASVTPARAISYHPCTKPEAAITLVEVDVFVGGAEARAQMYLVP